MLNNIVAPEIIEAWNVKKNLSSTDLSLFTPFVDLIALYKEKDDNEVITIDSIQKLGNNVTRATVGAGGVNSSGAIVRHDTRFSSFLERLVTYRLDGDDSGILAGQDLTSVIGADGKTSDGNRTGFVRGVPLTSTRYKSIIGKPGSDVVSVDSLEVEKGTADAFTVTFSMKLFIKDPALIAELIEFNSLLTLNSLFLINYGWIVPDYVGSEPVKIASESGGRFTSISRSQNPDPLVVPKGKYSNFNVSVAANNTWFSSYIVRLWKYDFSFTDAGALEATLDFMSPYMSTLTLIRSIDFQKTMLLFLDNPSSVIVDYTAMSRDITVDPEGFSKDNTVSTLSSGDADELLITRDRDSDGKDIPGTTFVIIVGVKIDDVFRVKGKPGDVAKGDRRATTRVSGDESQVDYSKDKFNTKFEETKRKIDGNETSRTGGWNISPGDPPIRTGAGRTDFEYLDPHRAFPIYQTHTKKIRYAETLGRTAGLGAFADSGTEIKTNIVIYDEDPEDFQLYIDNYILWMKRNYGGSKYVKRNFPGGETFAQWEARFRQNYKNKSFYNKLTDGTIRSVNTEGGAKKATVYYLSLIWLLSAINQALKLNGFKTFTFKTLPIEVDNRDSIKRMIVDFFTNAEDIIKLRSNDSEDKGAAGNVLRAAIESLITDNDEVSAGKDTGIGVESGFASTHLAAPTKNVGQFMYTYTSLKELFTSVDSSNTLLDMLKNITQQIALKTVEIIPYTVNGNSLNFEMASYKELGMTVDVQSSSLNSLTTENKKESNIFTINYGTARSLCKNITFSSSLDPNAWETYRLPTFAGGSSFGLFTSMVELLGLDLGAAKEQILQSLTVPGETESAETLAIRDIFNANPTAKIDQLYALILDVTRETDSSKKPGSAANITTSASGKLASAFERYLLRDMKKYVALQAMSATKNSASLFGTMMGYYLRRSNIVMHGICGLNAHNYLRIRGLVEGVSGIYSIVKIIDRIEKSGFETTLETMLLKPEFN